MPLPFKPRAGYVIGPLRGHDYYRWCSGSGSCFVQTESARGLYYKALLNSKFKGVYIPGEFSITRGRASRLTPVWLGRMGATELNF